uniref:Uncharacterized protein n=1 Tax=Picea glauca TaxID=3330 RepID=A0A117NHP6_PICGL|nr:hypothetical protein ABT39_MTgene4740 [Picea glauca]
MLSTLPNYPPQRYLPCLTPSTLSYLPEANPTKAKRRLRLSVPPPPQKPNSPQKKQDPHA